jgi:hypothetical protein
MIGAKRLALHCSAESIGANTQPQWKERFQDILFPEGFQFDGQAFGTAAICLNFSYLREVHGVALVVLGWPFGSSSGFMCLR